jgi:hypothetical protein
LKSIVDFVVVSSQILLFELDVFISLVVAVDDEDVVVIESNLNKDRFYLKIDMFFHLITCLLNLLV